MIDFKELEEVDLKLLLLSGSSILVDNLEIKPYTMAEIRDFGYSNYMKNLQWLLVTIEDFIDSIVDLEKRIIVQAEKSNLKPFDFYNNFAGHNMNEVFMEALSMVFKTEDVRMLDNNVVAVNFMKMGILIEDEYDGEIVVDEDKLNRTNPEGLTIIHRDNFDKIVEVIKLQNYLTSPKGKDSKEANPADEETKKLMEQMEKNRKKVEETKKKKAIAEGRDNEDESVDIADIISAVTAKSNSINKFNVWDMTLYQVYDEYARLELIDNYDFSIRAMMAGAEKVDLKHWSSKI